MQPVRCRPNTGSDALADTAPTAPTLRRVFSCPRCVQRHTERTSGPRRLTLDRLLETALGSPALVELLGQAGSYKNADWAAVFLALSSAGTGSG